MAAPNNMMLRLDGIKFMETVPLPVNDCWNCAPKQKLKGPNMISWSRLKLMDDFETATVPTLNNFASRCVSGVKELLLVS
eukprot:CAMPEP_0114325786 /NCGR_PEP_ID=MMETSP0059-20121206/29325_1 /TAXON_ID=36894 /ORGANISM="Pyramimonas parkeae, Strain CCMP726" /LENGTH=79 /DNA_ID=CAMNT_0001454613 /DNA_START=175 /DNA_END=414 /DNA_ORIENTATION=-